MRRHQAYGKPPALPYYRLDLAMWLSDRVAATMCKMAEKARVHHWLWRTASP
jgi:hypothetical protein